MKPTDNFVGPLLTDLYELTAAYAFWKAERHAVPATFDVFFRQNPFGGEFTVFAGLEEVLRFVSEFHFSAEDLAQIRKVVPGREEEFYKWLSTVDCSQVTIRAMAEGTVAFPHVPLLTVEGPLAIAQMLETTLLLLTNYPSLMATNAARFRLAAGPHKGLLEFGLRRAQGPDGGISASRYAYMGGFDATSNVKAGQLFGIPVKGTHMHAFVLAFEGLDSLPERTIRTPDGRQVDFLERVLHYREALGSARANEGELAAFIAYAQAFPETFLALIDSYDTLRSGLPNFLAVALALQETGYRPLGVRLDSGDLAYLSREVRKSFQAVSKRFNVNFVDLTIVASNDIDEETLYSLAQQGHEVDTFGIGTRLVTCYNQPALGGIDKLVAVMGHPRIKLSQDRSKVTIPGAKVPYRLIGREGYPLLDLITLVDEPAPEPGQRVLCRHPFDETKRAYVTPAAVMPLHQTVWDGRISIRLPALEEIRAHVARQIGTLRPDHIRALNPTPYKVSVSERLYDFMHRLWLQEAPISELR